ncbi:MAG TPA: rhomboid family intramembrane serine protease [Patescibacteria group bacterium]|nr:rhomboid family intramembrane serine protease [Patescibacteria group bacterium]
MLRWIIDDTKALIADLQRLGRRLSTRWQWMRLKSLKRVDDAASVLDNARRSAGTRTRMCTGCRALIPSDARKCPECGEEPGRPVTHGVARVIENMMPGFVSATSIILTINLALYGLSNLVYTRLLNGGLPPGARDGAWGAALILLGANSPWFTIHGEYWRLVTYAFLHGGLLHILMNSWALLSVGPLIEDIYGASKFYLVYLLTGVGAGLASLLWHLGSGAFSVGASGSIFGLIGLAAVWGWRRGGSVGEGIRGQMVQWAVYGLAMGFLLPGFQIDNAAHLGGLITGALMGTLLTDSQSARRAGSGAWGVVAMLGVIITLGSFLLVALSYPSVLSVIAAAS